MEYVIYLVTIGIIVFNKLYYKRIVTSFSLIILPYVLILFANNHIATKYLFIEIRQDTQIMLFWGCIFFFVGTLLVMWMNEYRPIYNLTTWQENKISLERVVPYVVFVLVIRIFQIIFLYLKHGMSGLMANDYELLLTRGFIAHLLLTIFPFMMLLFYAWLCNKKKYIYLILFLVFVLLAFIETEKAQVISVVLSTFLFCVIKNEKLLIKGLVIVIVLVSVFLSETILSNLHWKALLQTLKAFTISIDFGII